MPTLVNKYELYQQVLKLEFIREFHALVEAANGRGEFKADFTDKILALVGKMVEPVVDAGNVVLPGMPALVKKGAEAMIDKGNDARRTQKIHYFLQQGFEYNPNTLTVLAEQVSLAALKRYQWFVSQLEHDSVIRFAKAGVERMLEYLARKQLSLNLQHLLDGLLQGHSGAYMSGYFNTQLTPVDYLAERIPPSSRIKGALGFTSVTAEGIYGRSGLMTVDDDSSKLYLHAQFDKIKAKHKILEDEQEQSRFEKIKSVLSKEGRERWFDYGYTRAHTEYKEEPQYGYALVTPAEVNSYYGDQKNITTKSLVKLESKLKNSLTTFSYEIIPFNKNHLKNYLNAKKEIPQLTLLAYLKELFNAKNARLAYFDADDRDLSNLDLSGADLNECVFDYSIFSADLSNTTLRNSFLRHADFRLVTKAEGLDLSGAHGEYINAEGANLAGAILRSANLLAANLARANLTGADILGTNLLESNLQEAVSPNFNLGNIQAKQEQLAAREQRLEEKQSAQSEEISALRKTISELQASNQIDIAEKLDQFLQERAALEALKRYCRSEIEKLTSRAQQEKLSQQQAAHLQSLKLDLAELHKLQTASQQDGENLVSQCKQLSTQIDRQGPQLQEIEQLLDKLISGIQHQLNQYAQKLDHHEQRLDHLQVIKPNLEEKKPEPLPSLSIERLQQIKQELSASYQNRAVMFEFAPHQTTPLSLAMTEKAFIHLALVGQVQQQKERELREELKRNPDAEQKDAKRQQLLNSWEMLSQAQESIGINELWLEHKSDRSIPQHVLIEDSAGIGKTTLCGHIAAQWSQQKLWTERFAWVLWIPLRNLIDTGRYPQLANHNYSVKSFVLGECFGCLPNDRNPGLTINEQDRLWQQLQEQADRVLYVLDGYDEIAGYEKRPEMDYLKATLSQLWQSQHILLTTRPQVINADLLKKGHTRRLVTVGLSDDNIPVYVENYFKAISSHSEEKSLSRAEKKTADIAPLLEGLKANQTLWSVSHAPLQLSLICLAYAEGKIHAADLKQNLSLTQLYQKIVNSLLHRYFLKESLKGTADIEAKPIDADDVEREPNTQQVAQFLEVFAFQGMGQYDLILDKKLLQESLEATQQTFAIIPALIASGLLKEVNDQGNPAYQFVHLIFQEFFAARYLARKFQQPQPSINDWVQRFHEYKHIPRFAVMLWFTAGLLKDNPLHLQQFIQLLQAPPQDEVGLYHLGLVMRCVAEGGYHKGMTMQVSEYLGQLVNKCWIVIKEGSINNNGNQEIRAQSDQQVLRSLGQERLLTPKIEFPISCLNTIVKDLSDQELKIKRAAARALGELKAPTAEVLTALVALLNDENWQAREGAARALGELQAPTAEILRGLGALLNDQQSNVRQAAARVLGELKSLTPEILSALVALLKDQQWNIKQAAARALRELKAPTPEILPTLVALLKDESYSVRQDAAQALGELKAPTPEVLPALVALLNEEKWQAREGAVRALAELKTPTHDVLTALVVLLYDQQSNVRQAAARALGELKAPTPEVLTALVALLSDNDGDVKQAAAQALGELRAPTPEILTALVVLLNDQQWKVKQAAARALEELKMLTPEILSVLVALMKDQQWNVRQAATRILGELKAPTPEILSALIALLKDEIYLVRQAAAAALGELKAPIPKVLQGLVALLKDCMPEVRQAAAGALGELKASTPEILQGLVVLLMDEQWQAREGAARALGELKAPTPEILQGLGALLKDQQPNVKQAAARALGELKAPTPEILQDLVALLKGESYSVRQAAAEALRQFSTAVILKLYFQTSCQWFQSSSQEWLLNFIGQRWLVNRQVVKIVNQQIYWLEQGQGQQLLIPSNHPYFQYYIEKTIQALVGSRLSLIFPKVGNTANLSIFSQNQPPSPQSDQTDFTQPQFKSNKGP